MIEITFSHRYTKMPPNFENTKLLQLFVIDLKNLSREFKKYDTEYIKFENDKYILDYFPLHYCGKVMVLILHTEEKFWNSKITMWTTIRSWSKEKENFYKSQIGKEVKIIAPIGKI